jgi:hypothetical protein
MIATPPDVTQRVRDSGDASRIGAELAGLGQKNRDEIVAWLK